MVIGLRLHRELTSAFTPLHRFGNHFYLFLLRWLFAIPLTDLLSGYRVLSRDVARRVHLTSDGFQVETELTIKTIREGFRVVDRPVDLRARPAGSRSKIRVWRETVSRSWWNCSRCSHSRRRGCSSSAASGRAWR